MPPPPLPKHRARARRRRRQRACTRPAVARRPPQINTEPDFAAALASADVVAVDFMALWCRKCKYIKPKARVSAVSRAERTPRSPRTAAAPPPPARRPGPPTQPHPRPTPPFPLQLATMMADKFPAVPLVFVNVNAVPASVVSGAGVTKMPTIVVYVRGEVVSSYVAGDSAAAAVIRVETDVAAATKRAKQK